MNKVIFITIFTFLSYSRLSGQMMIPNAVILPSTLKNDSTQFTEHINQFLLKMDEGRIDTSMVYGENIALAVSVFNSFKGYQDENDTIQSIYTPYLINIFPISDNQYEASVAFIDSERLKAFVRFLIKAENAQYKFSLLLDRNTANWQTTQVGTVKYHHRTPLNLDVAKKFDATNQEIARKFGLTVDSFDFYLNHNYQEALNILGIEYDVLVNGEYRDGSGVDEKTIFAITGNEDFSHDVFHYYSEKIRTEKRNYPADEGFAYLWGNAYYTDKANNMIYVDQLVVELRKYIQQNPDVDLLELFNKRPYIFTEPAPELNIKSLLSALICNDVEKKHGLEGVKKLLNCGRGDDNFFKVTKELIGLERSNFNTEVMSLIEQF